MLGKLIKYEFKATARYFLPVYAAIILLALFTGLSSSGIENVDAPQWQQILQILLISGYIFSIIALAVLTLIITVNRFYKNLLGREGYLMFTLPVATAQNIFGKLIPAVIWVLGGLLVVGLSMLALLTSADLGLLFGGIFDAVRDAFLTLGAGNSILGIVELLALAITAIAATLLQIYLALAIGQLANEHKFLVAILAYIGIQTVLDIGGLILIFVGGAALESMLSPFSSMSVFGVAHTMLAGMTGISLAACALWFIPTWLLLDRKLNLA